jgi:hyperosmotically inducible periplasmic protein
MARFLLALMLTGAAFVGCESNANQRAQEAIDDASISTAVQAKLTGDRASNFSRVSVDSDRGVVHLSGVVSSAEQRKKAEELSRQVKGVRRVDNSLRIHHGSTTTGKLGD